MKRALALLLCLMVMFTSFPTAAFASEMPDATTTTEATTTTTVGETASTDGETTTTAQDATTTVQETTTTAQDATTTVQETTTTAQETTTTVQETTTTAQETTTTVQETTTTAQETTTTEQAAKPTEPVIMVPASQAEDEIYTLIVRFVYDKDNTVASRAVYAEYETGSSYSVDVPVIDGYDAFINGAAAPSKLTGTISANTTVEVRYVAKTVSYTVNHKVEQLDGTFKTYAETLTGKFGDETAAAENAEYAVGRTSYVPAPTLIVEGLVIEVVYKLDSVTVSFETNGGSYVSKKVLKYGATLLANSVDAPTKAGYTFAGWYTDAALTTPVSSSGIQVTADTTLYAKWNAGDAQYLIVYWQENANDNGYTIADTATATGKIGADATYAAKNYSDFTLNQAKTDEAAVTIAADGSTVRNVYYSRKTFTLKFVRKSDTSTQIGQTHTFKVGQSTASAEQWSRTEYRWEVSSSRYDEEGYSEPPAMPASNLTVYGVDNDADYKYITYYYEAGTNTQIKEPFVQYLDSTGYYATGVDLIDIPGFSNGYWNSKYPSVETNTGSDSNKYSRVRVWKFYYTRNSYDIIFQNGSQYGISTIKTDSGIKYQASIADKNFTPSNVTGVPSYVQFAGWYTHSSCVDGTEFNFTGATMPANDLYLYAKWIPVDVTVTFETNGGSAVASQTVKAGSAITAPADPEKAGYDFLGWYADDKLTEEYDMNTPVTGNITVYAKWELITDTRYTVEYVYADGTEFAPSKTYGGKVGETVSAVALTDDEYIADKPSATLVLSYDEALNVITFVYDKPQNIVYQVKYVCDGVEIKVDPVKSTDKTQMVFTAEPPSGYVAETSKITFVFENETETPVHNIIVFECILVSYKIEYDLDGGALEDGVTNPTAYNVNTPTFTLNNPTRFGYEFAGWTGVPAPEAETVTVTVEKGSTGDRAYTAHWIANTDVDYTVHYYESNTTTRLADDKVVTGQTFDSSVTENAIDITGYVLASEASVTITLDKYGKEIIFYYDKRTDLEYTVNYYLVGTTTSVKDSETVGSQTYKDEVTVEAAEIEGFVLADDESKTITIDVEGNVINFYYKKELTVTVDDITVTYGDDVTETYTATETFGSDVLTVTVTDTDKINVGTYTDELKVTSCTIARDGVDVTSQYEITTVPGTLVINPKTITIVAATASKTYDGTALTADSAKLAEGSSLAYDDVLSDVTVTGSQTDVGTSGNVAAEAVIVDKSGVDVTANYEISYTDGTLTVTPDTTAIIVTANSGDKVYDGTALTNDGYTVSYGGAALEGAILPNGDEVVATIAGSQTNVGGAAGNNEVTAVVIKCGDTVVYDSSAESKDYAYSSVTTVDGTLTVTARPVVITTGSAARVYNGTALTSDESSIDDLADGHKYTVEITGEQTNVGTSDNTYENLVITDAQDNDVTANYTVTDALGTLIVTADENAIVVIAKNASKVYDGAELTESGYTITYGGTEITDGVLPNGDTITAVVEGTITNVGTEDNVVTSILINGTESISGNNNYSSITAVDGELEITKCTVTITIDDASKIYDGTALVPETYTAEGVVEGETLTLTLAGSQTDAGTSHSNVLSGSLKIMSGSADVTGNYELVVNEGTLTVTKRAVVLTSADASKVYDGSALTKEEVAVSGDGFAEGEGATYSFTGTQTYAGSSENEFTYTLNEGVKADNYTITTVFGTLTVTTDNSSIVVTAKAASKVYDGTELTESGYVVEYDGTELEGNVLPNGDVVEAVIEGGITNVGTTENVVVSVVIKNGETVVYDSAAESDGYSYTDVTTKDGELEIESRAVTVTTASAEKVYDGTPLIKYEATVDNVAENQTWKLIMTGTQTDAGSSDNTYENFVISDAQGNDVTANYTVTDALGTLTVTADETEIVITAKDASKVYDGAELIESGYTVMYGETEITDGVLPTGDTVEVIVEGAITDVGTEANVVVSVLIDGVESIDGNNNYANISVADGTLTVEKRELVIVTGTSEKEYDNTALTNGSYTATGLALTDTLTVEITGSQLNAGTSKNTLASWTITREAASSDVEANIPTSLEADVEVVDCSANYDVTVVEGDLTVTPIAITITAGSAEDHYNGAALTCDEWEITSGKLVLDEKITSIKITGSQLNVGSSANVASDAVITKASGEDSTMNYEITYVDGTLTVLASETPVTGDSSNNAAFAVMMMMLSSFVMVASLALGRKKAQSK